MNLSEAITQYSIRLPEANKAQAQAELSRFARWVGWEREVHGLMPPEVAEYAESVASSGGDIRTRLVHLKDFLSYLKKQGTLALGLAAHVKVPKASRPLIQQRQTDIDEDAVVMTAAGLEALKQELRDLKGQREGIVADIRSAAADKDFRENAPLDAAREQQGQVEARIRELEATLAQAVVVEASMDGGGTTAQVGSKVVLQGDFSDSQVSYTLVGTTESDLAQGKISVVSPVGKAVMGHSPGDEIEVAAPRGSFKYRLVSVER